MLKIDLHTHSLASPDGGITEKEYTESIAKKVLDYIAITDHNRIDFAQKMQQKLGSHIIVGEEIMTKAGEVIGLFLRVKVRPYQSLARTIQLIHEQGGLVYVPHPFDKMRHGIGEKNLLEYKNEIDILEGFNSRMLWKNGNTRAKKFALQHGIVAGVGSDAHEKSGIGRTYAIIKKQCTSTSTKSILKEATLVTVYQPLAAYLSPKLNRLKKLLTKDQPWFEARTRLIL